MVPQDVTKRLEGVRRLTVEPREFSNGSSCCSFTTRERTVTIYDQDKQPCMYAAEEHSWLGRLLAGPYHAWTMPLVLQGNQDPSFQLRRPFRCCAMAPVLGPCCQQRLEVYDGPGETLVGSASQPLLGGAGGLFHPTVQLMNKDSEMPFASIEGPCFVSGGLSSFCCDQKFRINHKVAYGIGHVERVRPDRITEVLHRSYPATQDIFSMQVHPDLPVGQKITLLASLLLLHYTFLDGDSCIRCQAYPPYCTSMLCYMHFCGCHVPCGLVCGCKRVEPRKNQVSSDDQRRK